MAILRNRVLTQILKRSKNNVFTHKSYSVSSAAASEPEMGDGFWSKEYEDYRKSLYGGNITHKALFVDAVGTLLVPAQSTPKIYKEIGKKYGVKYSENEILHRYRWAYEQPWRRSTLSVVLGNFWALGEK